MYLSLSAEENYIRSNMKYYSGQEVKVSEIKKDHNNWEINYQYNDKHRSPILTIYSGKNLAEGLQATVVGKELYVKLQEERYEGK